MGDVETLSQDFAQLGLFTERVPGEVCQERRKGTEWRLQRMHDDARVDWEWGCWSCPLQQLKTVGAMDNFDMVACGGKKVRQPGNHNGVAPKVLGWEKSCQQAKAHTVDCKALTKA